MSELTLILMKLGFLAVLWLFVLSTVSVIRSDLYGAKVDARRRPVSRQAPAKAARPAKPARTGRGAPSRLLVVDGVNAGTSVPLGDLPILLGRASDASIRIDDDYVSTRHARFVPSDGQWFLEDLGSTNGTYLGSQRVTVPTAVGVGTPVRLGKTVVELRK
ncbi:MAG TPA: FHA domain-containing protein [Nocardioidaceae bacterium]|jgi:pSer/pThr/pTyr-binding forkhead associated (FHA) protein|nr:FHA domain-containing protein [Nocardioidaceae bacterium]